MSRPQVQVNRQAVALPYKKYGLQVYQSGINYVVDIPELGALISYDSLSFSIRLPYHRFGNNTKGQCGEPLAPRALPQGGCPGCGWLRAPAPAVVALSAVQAPTALSGLGSCGKPIGA